jgi:hypothetical protein
MVPLRDRPIMDVKYCTECVFFDNIYVSYVKICLICSKVEFITNITYIIGMHTFCFYNNKHTFTTTDTKCITRHTHFTKTNTNPIMGPKCDPPNKWLLQFH